MNQTMPTSRGRRIALAAAAGYCWLRITLVLSSHAFETPDTESYRSGQATRPPVSAALLSWLGDTPYVVLSVIVSTAGFVAMAYTLWNPQRRRWSYGVIGALALFSLIPTVSVYEHWLVPDSLLVGLALLGLSLAARRSPSRWHSGTLVALCLVITATKEVGVAVVVLLALVLVVRRHARVAAGAFLASALLFVIVVLPCSSREGTVIWREPATTQLTMERFRVVVASLFWYQISPDLAQVKVEAAACGMDMQQMTLETVRLTSSVVNFEHCPRLWAAVDRVSQFDILLMHVRHPRYVPPAIERGFAPDMWAMSVWSGYPFQQRWLLDIDRALAAGFALAPIGALVVCALRRRGRRLALIALLGSVIALAAALVDPTGQDRHAIVFRVVAAAIALLALTDATASGQDSRHIDFREDPPTDLVAEPAQNMPAEAPSTGRGALTP